MPTDSSHRPHIRVHECGLIVPQIAGERFVPRADVTGIQLTASALTLAVRDSRPIHIDRSVLEEPTSIAEELTRWIDGP